ncbi:MAG: tyrosine--tRNA ligase [Caldilineaceae bacterium]|nr:tyrosine--tRNA ligase [Caldilineaceae bacterium]
MKKFLPVEDQMRILMRGVDFGDDQTYANMKKELEERLQKSYETGTPLRVYCGFDPSAPDLHLGHTIPMRKLRQFQDLGHDVTFLIGTFTGTIGDPSDRESARSQQTVADAMEKGASYAKQAFRVLDPDKTTVRYNHQWLSELNFSDVIGLASNFTVQQFLARDNFSKRHENGDAIWLHEFFYALMQGYDAVALETDVQVGGTDQLFNLMAGRKLMDAQEMKPQTILTFPILVGTDGVLRMSKSTGNYIGIDEPSGVIFTKVLNVPDSAMRNYAELVTRWDQQDIDRMFANVEAGNLTMRDLKHDLAYEIVSIFHGEEAAEQAAADARRMHEGQAPSDAQVYQLEADKSVLDILWEAGLVKSKGEGRRLIQQGGVRLDGESVTTIEQLVSAQPGPEQTLQAGKRKFLRIQTR